MKKTLIAIFATLATMTATAGEMRTLKDQFTGQTRVSFISNLKEAQQANAIVRLSKGDNGLVYVIVAPFPERVTDCGDNYVLLKDRNGVVHKIDATEVENRRCEFQVHPTLITNGFTLRVPMYRGNNLDVYFSTTGLKINQLTD
jgi:hypothetical protein